jgi:hypothetical protein
MRFQWPRREHWKIATTPVRFAHLATLDADRLTLAADVFRHLTLAADALGHW